MKTWLSRIPNNHGQSVDRYDLHCRLWEAYPGHKRGEPQPCQFRVDEESGTILVRSIEKPQWPFPVDMTEEHHDWAEDDRVQVDIHLTPVLQHHGKEIPMTVEHERAFIERKLAEAGLCPVSVGFEEADDADLPPPLDVGFLWVNLKPEKVRRANIRGRRVRCLARVENAKALQAAMSNGIGPKKHLGFGMILLVAADFVL